MPNIKLTLHLMFEKEEGAIVGRCLEIPGVTGRGHFIADAQADLWRKLLRKLERQAARTRAQFDAGAVEVELVLK